MSKPIPEHRDKLGRVLSIGEYVAFPESNKLHFGTIVKINPKMLRIKALSKTWEVNKYPDDTVRIEGPDLIWYLLKK